MSPIAPQSLLDGRYELYERLGRGGMAEVIRGWDRRLRRDVAIKFLAHRYSQDTGLVDRFRQEIATLAQLDHPNVVTIFDTGETDDGRLYLVMERLQGETLDRTLRGLRDRGEAIGWARLAAIGRQICSALQSAHTRQIVHRDIKPSNIFRLSVDGNRDFVKILDFGIAKVVAGSLESDDEGQAPVTAMGAFVGTPHYAAPELIAPERHGSADLRADIFSLGVVLYECATGVLPFEGIPKVAVLSRTALERLPPPRQRAPEREIPRVLESIIIRATSLSPADRYPSARALSDALAAFEASVSRPPLVGKPDLLSGGGATGVDAPTPSASVAGVNVSTGPVGPTSGDDRSWSLPAGFGKRRPPPPQAPRLTRAKESTTASPPPRPPAPTPPGPRPRSAPGVPAEGLGTAGPSEERAEVTASDAEERTTHQRVDGRTIASESGPEAPRSPDQPERDELIDEDAVENPSTDAPLGGAVEATAPSALAEPAESPNGMGLLGTAIAVLLAAVVVVTWLVMPSISEKNRTPASMPLEIVSVDPTPGGPRAKPKAKAGDESTTKGSAEISTSSGAAVEPTPRPRDTTPADLGIDEPIYPEDEPARSIDATRRACLNALKQALESKTPAVVTCLRTNGVLMGVTELEVRVRATIVESGGLQVSIIRENLQSTGARACILEQLSAATVGCRDAGITRTYPYIFAAFGSSK